MKIVLRADSGFTREELMAWCEATGVDYVFGLARNPHLLDQIEAELAGAAAEHAATGDPVRRFKDFTYATLTRRRGCRTAVLGSPVIGAFLIL